MGLSVSVLPSLNEPVFAWWPTSHLPPLTRWVLISAIIAFIVWLVFYLMDRNNHNNHTKNCKKLKSRLGVLEARMDRHFPDSPVTTSP